MAMSDRCELAAVACLAHAQSGVRGSIAPWQCLSRQVEHVSGVASLASTKDEQAQHFDFRVDANRRDGLRLSSYHEDGLQPSRLSPHRVSEHGTLTPCCALTVLRSKLVGPEGWQNAAGGRPIGHVCRLWYPYGGLRRFGGSPATLGELVVWAGHGGRVGSPAPPRGASEGAENVTLYLLTSSGARLRSQFRHPDPPDRVLGRIGAFTDPRGTLGITGHASHSASKYCLLSKGEEPMPALAVIGGWLYRRVLCTRSNRTLALPSLTALLK